MVVREVIAHPIAPSILIHGLEAPPSKRHVRISSPFSKYRGLLHKKIHHSWPGQHRLTFTELSPTFFKSHWLLGNHPMTAVNVPQLEPWEEASNQRQDVIIHIVTLRSAYKECIPFIFCFVRVFKGKIPHMFKVRGEYVDWNPQTEIICSWCPNQIREQKLPYWQGLNSELPQLEFLLYCAYKQAVS